MLFFIKQNYIDYIRDHCKLIAFNIIKTRYLNKNNTNFYVIVQKMFEDFNNIYAEFNSYKIADTTLYDLNFNIKKKIFNEFLIKYTIIIAFLQLFE